MVKKRMRSIAAALLVLVSAFLLAACSAQAREEAAYDGGYGNYAVAETAAAAMEMAYEVPAADYAMAKAAGAMEEQGVSESELQAAADPAPTQRKLIRNFDVSIQTTKFDDLYNGIKNKVNALGGYIENSGIYNNNAYGDGSRNGSLTARIPDDKVEEFMNTAFVEGTIISMNESTEDVTLRYSELSSRVESLETEKARLNELLKSAPDVESIILIEERLSEVRSEIENIRSNLRNMDNRVSYSTVWININEVKVIEPTKKATFWERLSSGFVKNTNEFFSGLEDFIIWFLTNIFGIAVTVAIIVGIVLLIKKIVSGSKKKKAEKKAKKSKKENGTEGTVPSDGETAETAEKSEE